MSATIHASCVAIGDAGVLIRGASGAGKTTLALLLVDDAALRGLPARLVADDRVALAVSDGGVVASPPPALAGLVEIRGRGVEAEPFAPLVVLRLVVDLVPAAALPRLPEPDELVAELLGRTLPRQPVPIGDPLRAMLLVRRALAAT